MCVYRTVRTDSPPLPLRRPLSSISAYIALSWGAFNFCSDVEPIRRKGKLICSRRCKDRRYARLHPEAVRAKQRRKDELAAPP